jgi:hypothetical protein
VHYESFKNFTASIQSIITSVALVGGGVWAYWRFVLNRESAHKVDVDVEVTFVLKQGDNWIIEAVAAGEKSGELHFTKPFGRARHYIGWSPDINRRVSRHKEGKGAKFTMGALRHGADLLLVRIWPGGDRRLEWELKHKDTHQALCALCSPLPARLESPCLLATRLQREGLTTTVREPERVCASDIAKKLDRQKPRKYSME